MGYKVAVVGATGAVGREMLKTLAERRFPVGEVVALASARSTGQQVSFGEDQVLTVRNLETFDFTGTDIGLFSPGASISAVHAPRAAAQGCVVIDNTSQFRMDEDVPLVVPEVNREALEGFRQRNIVANPNCSTIQMVVALKPLHDIARIKRIVVATYQSVSGGGREAMDELFEDTKAIYMNQQREPKSFPRALPFNVIPQIDVFMEDGSTKEEWKMSAETRKILDPAIEVTATCVRVPVFIGHSEAVNVEFEEPISPEEARAAVWEAYAEVWRAAYPQVDLDAAWARVCEVERVFQMITFEQIYRVQPEGSRWELATIVVEILDKLVEARRGATARSSSHRDARQVH